MAVRLRSFFGDYVQWMTPNYLLCILAIHASILGGR